jgi:hypothetical protein
MRPNAIASACPASIAASALSPVKPPTEIRTPFQFPDGAEQHHRRRHILVIDLGTPGSARSRLDEMQVGKAEPVE